MTTRFRLHVTMCIVIALSVAGCCPKATFKHLEPPDLLGTWRADYDEQYYRSRCWYTVSGVERLTLRADGTYQQVYDDGKGYLYTSPWNRWYLEDHRGSAVLRLEGARFYPLGIEDAEKMAKGELVYQAIDYTGASVDLDGTEVLLYVYVGTGTPGGMQLRHLEVCDPDSPAIVDFYLESTPPPTPTILP